MKKLIASLSAVAFLAACEDSSNDTEAVSTSLPIFANAAVVRLIAPDFSSSDLGLINSDAPTQVYDSVAPVANSDMDINAYGEFFYRMERYGSNTISKYSIHNPDTAIWEFSTNDEGEDNSNPYQILQISYNKAYLLRYGSNKVWVVDPSAQSADDFKVGEINLSAYVSSADTDGVAEVAAAAYHKGKVFIVMQRLVSYNPSVAGQDAYIAVIDSFTDTEIDTNVATGVDADLKGIPLGVRNPSQVQIIGDNLYVQAVGDYGSSFSTPAREKAYTGGIEKVSLADYSKNLIQDDNNFDGEGTDAQISGMYIANEINGYFITYFGWKDNSVYQFNPSDNTVAPTLLDNQYLDHTSIADSAITRSPDGLLWVSIANANAPAINIYSINEDSHTLKHQLTTTLNPSRVVFVKDLHKTVSN